MRYLLVLLLMGCTGPTVLKEPLEVKIPLVVPCDPIEVPQFATDNLAKDADYPAKVKAAFVELAQRMEYEIQLIKACKFKEKP